MKRALEVILFVAVIAITATMASRFIVKRRAASFAPARAASYLGEDVEPSSKSSSRPLKPNERSVGGFPGSDDSFASHRPGVVPPPKP